MKNRNLLRTIAFLMTAVVVVTTDVTSVYAIEADYTLPLEQKQIDVEESNQQYNENVKEADLYEQDLENLGEPLLDESAITDGYESDGLIYSEAEIARYASPINAYDVSFAKKAITLPGALDNRFTGYWTFNADVPNIVSFWDKYGIYNVAYPTGGKVRIYRYNYNLEYISDLEINMELPLWGNITGDGNYYYVITGQNDNDACTNCIVTCAAKYDLNGNKIGCLELTGNQSCGESMGTSMGTRYPFDAGTCSVTIQEGILSCIYAREMFSGHQSDYVFYADTNDMTEVSGARAYVSHSFDQYVLPTNDGGLMFANHGDAFFRAFMLEKVDANRKENKNISLFHFREGANRDHGYNETYAQFGGLVETFNNYVFCGSSEKTLSYDTAPTDARFCGKSEARNLFVQVLKKDYLKYATNGSKTTPEMFAVEGEARVATGTAPSNALTDLYLGDNVVDYGVVWLTDYDTDSYVCNPKIVWDGHGHVVILWEKLYYSSRAGVTYYAIYDENFNVIKGATLLENAYLPGNADVVYKDGAIYWVSKNDYGTHINVLDLGISSDNQKKIALKENYICDYYQTKHQMELTTDSSVNMSDMTWYSEDEEIATVDANGIVTIGAKKGQTNIVGYHETMENQVKCRVEVKPYSISYDTSDGGFYYKKTNQYGTTEYADNPYLYYPTKTTTADLLGGMRPGYDISGWYLDKELTVRFDPSNATEYGNVVLYPKWGNSYLYMYCKKIMDDGSCGSTTATSTYIWSNNMPYDIKSNSTIIAGVESNLATVNATRKANNQNPLKLDYFSTDAEGRNRIDEITVDVFNVRKSDDGEGYVKNTSINLYPQVKEITSYKVEYVLYGGTNNSQNISTYPVNSSGSFALRTPTKTGYTFGGWFTDSKYTDTSKVTSIDYSNESDVVLYAKWTKNDTSSELYGVCGDRVYWTLNTTTGALDIKGEGKTYVYSSYAKSPWYGKNIKSVTIAEGVESLPGYAFYYQKNISEIHLPSTLTEAGRSVFLNCSATYTLYIPSWESLMNIEYYHQDSTPLSKAKAIYVGGTPADKNLALPKGNGTVPDYMFAGCTWLTGIRFTEGPMKIGNNSFVNCSNLTSVSLKNVESIGAFAFWYDKNLTGIMNISSDTKSISNRPFSYTGITGFSCASYDIAATWSSDWNHNENSVAINTTYLDMGGGTAVTGDKVVAKGAYLRLDGTTNLCFVLDLNGVSDAASKIKVDNKEYKISDLTKVGNEWSVVYPVPAKDINRKISVSVCDSKGNRIAFTNSYDTRFDNDILLYSVSDYVDEIRNGNYSDKMKSLADAINVYGTTAGNFFEICNKPVSLEKDKNAFLNYKSISGGTMPDGVKFEGASLLIEDTTKIRFYFSGDVTGCRFYYGGRELNANIVGNYCFVESLPIAAPELGNMRDMKITNGKQTYIMSYSPLTYCGKAIDSGNGLLENIAMALVRYNEASRSYFGR